MIHEHTILPRNYDITREACLAKGQSLTQSLLDDLGIPRGVPQVNYRGFPVVGVDLVDSDGVVVDVVDGVTVTVTAYTVHAPPRYIKALTSLKFASPPSSLSSNPLLSLMRINPSIKVLYKIKGSLTSHFAMQKLNINREHFPRLVSPPSGFPSVLPKHLQNLTLTAARTHAFNLLHNLPSPDWITFLAHSSEFCLDPERKAKSVFPAIDLDAFRDLET